MQNNFGGIHFTLKFSPGFQDERSEVEERERGGEGGRDRREEDVNIHLLYLFIKIKI